MSGTAAMAPPGLPERLRDRYDRLLASAGFRQFAARFPLTRPLARRRVRALFDLCAGFVYTQTLLACVRLRVFEILRDGPQEHAALAARLGLSPEAAATLLKAAEALRLVDRRRGGRWGLGALGAALVDNPGVTAMVEHHALVYGDLADPVALLRRDRGGNRLSGYWPYAGAEAPAALPEERVAAYTALMAASQPFVAAEVLAACDFSRHRHLLDLGGGDGSFLRAVAARHPHLRLTLFDLPAVAARARDAFATAGLADRAEAFGGDFTHGPLPLGADIVSLVRIIHDHDDARALAILRAARRALPPGGTLLLAEPMSGTPGAEPITEAYFGFYLLAMGTGRPRRPEELAELLRGAGFTAPRLLSTRTPLLARVMVARAA
ncbi:methyltransferase [Roseicella aquatilis]|uniref:Methyltransferase domain-containing protein n=1 Tax=Roseicella aquatilis TaxID=2527868 RepID=A0A4R4DY32_9PROT|nr:methyltransferase [Roseicella aquatilis]TCZ65975.1 methyltransferase domain-containing protein [Roseicella aquatilis]